MIILVVSDIHGNLPALEAVLTDAGAFDQIWNLGDTVGYGGSPNECADLIRGLPNQISLAGNHDLAAVGLISTSNFNPMAAAANAWTGSTLSAENHVWLSSLPSSTSEGTAFIAHGSPREPVTEYVLSANQVQENFAYYEERVCFVGHSHIQFIAGVTSNSSNVKMLAAKPGGQYALAAGKWLVNPGSVGQPRDQNARAAYAIFDSGSFDVSMYRVPYDIERAQTAIREAGLPDALAVRLELGR